ncbi:MAG: hypothetical protein CSA66_06185 [Proteobacteria bacterium]|nr:MAG: hypothetical protein CSA66_06185 [Pseudomonadota bacterium]
MESMVTALCAALEGHIEVLRALVRASQRQQRAIIGFRTAMDEVHASAEQVASTNAEILDLKAALGERHHEVQLLVQAACQRLELDPDNAGLSDIVATLDPELREPLSLQMSCVRSLVEALDELQRLNQAHAQRGLQLLHAWMSLLSGDGGRSSAQTYTQRGRRRLSKKDMAASLLISA